MGQTGDEGRGRPRVAVIAAGGRGTRAVAVTAYLPKPLLRVAGHTLLERNLILLRDQVGITDVRVVVWHRQAAVRQAVGDGSHLGLTVACVANPDSDRGLGTVLGAVRDAGLDEPFVLLLGDELYLGSNHAQLTVPADPFRAVCGLLPCDDPARINRNYGVVFAPDGSVARVLEKPPPGTVAPWLGCGTFLFHPDVFADLDRTAVSPRTGTLELVDVVDTAARDGAVRPFPLTGSYVNVNAPEDLVAAERLLLG